MNIEQINQKDQFIDIPDGEQMKQGVKEKLPFHESPQYNSLKNHLSTDMGDLPFVLDGLSMVGDVKDMDVKMVIAKKHDGTNVELVEPFDAIMSGRASTTETHDFLQHYLRTRIMPTTPMIHRGEKPKSKDINSKIWYKHLPEFMKIIEEENNSIDLVKRSDDFEVIKEKLYSESILKIKLLSAEALKEMKTAQEKFNEGDVDYIYDNYAGYTETQY